MNYFQRLGENIGKQVVNDMVASGEMKNIVSEAVADEFEKMAKEPKYVKIKSKLLEGAKKIRSELPKKQEPLPTKRGFWYNLIFGEP